MDDRQRFATQMHEMFGRHFVSFAGSYFQLNKQGKPTGKPAGFNFSAFVLSVRGQWNLVTAGHILSNLESHLNAKQIVLNHSYLVDSYGPDPTTSQPTPFVFEDAPKMYVDRDGLDFGLIALSQYYVESLRANGVLPFGEIDWVNQPVDFDAFYLLGLPTEMNRPSFDSTSLILNPLIMRLDRLEGVPPCFDETPYPRFFGHLRDPGEIKDIDGMSGGPVFGIGKDADGNCRYWVVGIQSGWLASKRIIAATPLPVVGRLIEGIIADYESQAIG